MKAETISKIEARVSLMPYHATAKEIYELQSQLKERDAEIESLTNQLNNIEST